MNQLTTFYGKSIVKLKINTFHVFTLLTRTLLESKVDSICRRWINPTWLGHFYFSWNSLWGIELSALFTRKLRLRFWLNLLCQLLNYRRKLSKRRGRGEVMRFLFFAFLRLLFFVLDSSVFVHFILYYYRTNRQNLYKEFIKFINYDYRNENFLDIQLFHLENV